MVGNLGDDRESRGGGGHKSYEARHFIFGLLLPMASNES